MKTGPVFDSKKFSFLKDSRMFVAEASDLGPSFAGRLFDDACDYGMWVRSHKTGKVVSFLLERQGFSPEGDLLYWKFRSWDLDPRASGIELRVYND